MNTLQLLVKRIKAPSSERNDLFDQLLEFSPDVLLELSMALYEQTCNEQYLLQALSLVSAMGKKAWPALKSLAGSGHMGCEVFVDLIANCEGIPVTERAEAVRELSLNPNSEVRAAVYDNFSDFEEEVKQRVME